MQDDQKKLLALLKELESFTKIDDDVLARLKKKYPKADSNLFKKSEIVNAYRKFAGNHGIKSFDRKLIEKITKRPVRTQSGVTPVTVLTKPFPCPGKCIFCPSDVRMPKSYLANEPGAQRAERNWFDPYLQTYNRLLALHNMGHNVDKVELIVLGGTWSYYPESYQVWFISKCFRALNDFNPKPTPLSSRSSHLARNQRGDKLGISSLPRLSKIKKQYEAIADKLSDNNKFSLTDNPDDNEKRATSYESQVISHERAYNDLISEMYVAPERELGLDKFQSASWDELFEQQKINETAKIRCVGLSLETRPDNISEAEIVLLRKLGCTKTQIGVQSLQDEVLKLNHRGHDVAATRKAFRLLRQSGFKIHAHWMANLYGSNVEKDKNDYLKLFQDPDFKPDELKIYPCSLIKSAELMQYFNSGKWQPYSHEELLEVISFVLQNTPAYCRLTRIIRDISSTDIVVGNKKTNFRQIAEDKLREQEVSSVDIRAREVRNSEFRMQDARYNQIEYETSVSDEIFIQVLVDNQKLLAFLRLSLPTEKPFIDELSDAAIIREIHVYGPAQRLGVRDERLEISEKTQHRGFGTELIKKAKKIARAKGYKKLAVISSVGTREYYRKRGFKDGNLYQFFDLSSMPKRTLVN